MAQWEEYPEIYHYTTQAGLVGILDSQSLHATHYAFMNDHKEMHSFETRVEQLMLVHTNSLYDALAGNRKVKKKLDAEGGAGQLALHDAAAVVGAMYRITLGLEPGSIKFLQPFLVSFCAHKNKYEQENGLLSQWRCYGKDSGYALVFGTNELDELRKAEMHRYRYDLSGMGTVFYDLDDESFQKEFMPLAEAIKNDLPRMLSGDDGSYAELNTQFLNGVVKYKHRAFFEEQEVRMMFSPTDDKRLELAGKNSKLGEKEKRPVKYRANMAPYISLFEGPDFELPITRIIVGPHADRELRKARLQKYLDLKRLEISVACSETPVLL